MIEILKELHGIGWPGAVVVSVFLIVAAALIVIAMRQFCDRPEDSAEQSKPVEPPKPMFQNRGSLGYYARIENMVEAQRVDNERQWRFIRQTNNLPTSTTPPNSK